MANGVLRAVSELLSRAARKLRSSGPYRSGSVLLSRRLSLHPFLGEKNRHVGPTEKKKKKKKKKNKCDDDDEEKDDELWRKGIIMGEKCEPFDFSGVIYYDSDGRQLAEVPKSPMRKSWN